MFWCLQENSIFKQHHPQKKKKTNSYKPPKKQTTKPLEKTPNFSVNRTEFLANGTILWMIEELLWATSPRSGFFQPFKPKGSETAEPVLEMLLKLSKLRNQVERIKRVRNKRNQGHKKIRKLHENHMEIWFFNGTDSTKKQWQKWIQSNFGVVSPWKFLLSSNPWSEISRWKRTSHKVSLARSSMNPLFLWS